MKRAMAVESQRIDVILKEFDKPEAPRNYAGPYIAQKKTKTELVNDYADLYKNFSEFNARYIPERAREIKVPAPHQNIEPYHVTQHKAVLNPPHHTELPTRQPVQPVRPPHPARANPPAALRSAPQHQLLRLAQTARLPRAGPRRQARQRRPFLRPLALQAAERPPAQSRPQRQAWRRA